MRARTVVLTALLVLCAPLAAGAHPEPVADGALQGRAKATNRHHQHGGEHGHLPKSDANVRLVGKAAINQDSKEGRVADVGVFDDHAYLAAFWEPTCQKGGVYVFDIADPTKPKQINFIRTSNDTYVGEGVQVIHIDTPAYEGDVLLMNNEICNEGTGDEKHPNGGVSFVDVTNPKVHRYLSEHAGDLQPDGDMHESHSAFMWDAGNKAYAVIVDNEEELDVDILDITDPRNPVLRWEYELDAMAPITQPGQGLDEVFHHDVNVKQVSPGVWHMVVSYWDAGYVVMDVTDPANATILRDSDFTIPDPEAAESGLNVAPEGNGHEAEFTLDSQYIVAADEDFNPYKVIASNVDEGTTFTAVQGSAVPGVPQGGSIAGDTVYVGQACDADTAVPPAGGPGKIAVAARGTCTFQEKYDNVVGAGGYEALLIANRENQGLTDGCDTLVNMLVSGDTLPAFFIQRRVGFDLFGAAYNHAACLAGSATHLPVTFGISGDDVSLTSTFDGWGYVHLYRNSGVKLTELDTYAIPQAHDEDFATGFGDLSVHEAATSPTDSRLVYFSYYAGGFRWFASLRAKISRRSGTSSTTKATTSGESRCSITTATSTLPPATETSGSTSSSTPVHSAARD